MKTVDRTDRSAEPKCKQCGNKSPEQGFTNKNVTHRAYDHERGKAVLQTSVFTVCKDTACGGNLQMGYEG